MHLCGMVGSYGPCFPGGQCVVRKGMEKSNKNGQGLG